MIVDKLTFTGHDTFHCRHFWLKKGVDFVVNGGDFNEDQAVLELGVGKNMVASIHFWLKAFGIKKEDGMVSELATKMLGPEGWDEYLEFPGSLWIWQYQLVNHGFASIYSLFFKEFRKSRFHNQFRIEQFKQFLKRKSEGKVADKTLENDIKVFIKTYLVEDRMGKGIEDDLSSVFVELNLLSVIETDSLEKVYQLHVDEKTEIPSLVFLFFILDTFGDQVSIAFEDIKDTVGDALACSDEGVEYHIGKLCEEHDQWLVYKEDAGRKEIQFKKMLDKWKVLEAYYHE